MLRISPNAWRLLLLSAGLQIVIFPLPNLYWLSWIAVAPLLVAMLRAREPETLQMDGASRRLPASPGQGFVLGYACGMVWFGGTCYWIFDTMHRYGGLPVPAAVVVQILFCLYVGLYHGMFGLLLAWVAGPGSKPVDTALRIRRALAAAPFLWVAVELARTRITAFPWELLGYAQTHNFALARLATMTGVYGLSFEIVLVNSVFAAAFLAPKGRRRWLLAAAFGAAGLLQAGQWWSPPALATNHTAVLMQPNIPVQEGARWTQAYFESTLRELSARSLQLAGRGPSLGAAAALPVRPEAARVSLIVWPESPSPFYTNDPLFRDAVGALARQAGTWVVAGAIGVTPGMQSGRDSAQIFNSAALVNPRGEWVGRYDKVHLVPFGEYLPFPQLFAFAGGLTKEVGEFQHGDSHRPLEAGSERLGTFICYESIFPDEVRQGPLQGAEVLVNLSNDGWYGDSGAWKQHLQQTQMRAIENDRWLLSATNTGQTASIDPEGRIVAATERKMRTGLVAPYAPISDTTFYTRHGDWFAYLCAIISAGALFLRFARSARSSQRAGSLYGR